MSRCSAEGAAAVAVHGGRAPASGRTNGETVAAPFGAVAAAADGGADRHCPTVERHCGRGRRRHYPPSPPWVKQEEAPSVVGVSSNQDSSSVTQLVRAEQRRGAKRCLARSGMRDLITGAINEASDGRTSCRGLSERRTAEEGDLR